MTKAKPQKITTCPNCLRKLRIQWRLLDRVQYANKQAIIKIGLSICQPCQLVNHHYFGPPELAQPIMDEYLKFIGQKPQGCLGQQRL